MPAPIRIQQCPVSHTDFSTDTEIYGHYAMLDAEREASRFRFNDTTDRGFLMIQRYDDVVEGFQHHETWTTKVRSAINPDSRSGTALLPQDLNGEAHAKLRRVLNPFFSPAAVRRMEPMAVARCIELIEELQPKGSCDFVAEFAIRYPTDLFLALLGLPVSDGEFFLPWSETVFAGFFGEDPAKVAEARKNIIDYFTETIRERRANPRDPKEDMVTRLLEARIDGTPIPEEDILTICLTLMLAGLDTTRSALGYIYAHLARNDADRQAIIDNPDLVPRAVEEFLRMYRWSSKSDGKSRNPPSSTASTCNPATWCGWGSPKPTVTRASSPNPTGSTPTAKASTSTSRSVPGRTAASACTWPVSNSRSCCANGTSASRTTASEKA